jgi:hypothetical protein
MIFLRTTLGVLLVACLVALAGFGYRLWQVERELATRVDALEQQRQTASTEADVAAIRACYDQLRKNVLTDVRVDGDTARGQELRVSGGALAARPITFRRIDGRWSIEAEPAASQEAEPGPP